MRATELIEAVGKEIVPESNRFLELLEAGRVPEERLGWIAGEQYRILRSDMRSFSLFATRFPESPAGDLFIGLSQGEREALRLLLRYAGAVGLDETALARYEPRPLAQAYPAHVAWCAAFGSLSGLTVAMLANLHVWGAYCVRTADALVSRYGLGEPAVEFFRFFGSPPPGFEDQAREVVEQGLAMDDDPAEAMTAARLMHAYELSYWEALAEGLS